MKRQSALVKSVNIYFGPSIPGVIHKFSTFTGEPSGKLLKAMDEYPILKDLTVTTDEYSKISRELSDKNSRISVIYERAAELINK